MGMDLELVGRQTDYSRFCFFEVLFFKKSGSHLTLKADASLFFVFLKIHNILYNLVILYTILAF